MIRTYGLRADRRLGQHFLLDPAILTRIATASGNLCGSTILEVGPGPGGLTRALLDAGADLVVAIERDGRCVLALQDLARESADRLLVIEGDALEIPLSDLPAPPPYLIVANLPYNIGTALLIRWLDQIADIEDMILMFQREVGDRLAAGPKTSAYGRLSVLVQWLCCVRPLFHLPAAAFTPPPKVASTLLRVTPRPEPLAPAPKPALERVVAAAFGQRRKMLRTSLKSLGLPPLPLIEEAGLKAEARAEEIDVAGFCRLAKAFAAATHRKSKLGNQR